MDIVHVNSLYNKKIIMVPFQVWNMNWSCNLGNATHSLRHPGQTWGTGGALWGFWLSALPEWLGDQLVLVLAFLEGCAGGRGGGDKIEGFLQNTNSFHPTKFTAEISETETEFLDTKVYRGDRFIREPILDVRTHFKPLDTFQYMNLFVTPTL